MRQLLAEENVELEKKDKNCTCMDGVAAPAHTTGDDRSSHDSGAIFLFCITARTKHTMIYERACSEAALARFSQVAEKISLMQLIPVYERFLRFLFSAFSYCV